MGNLFLLCGPPGSGKTTLLKLIKKRRLPLRQLRRITTREPRREEGDQGKANLEYEFLTIEEFAGRLARGSSANFIEWNGSMYATDLDDLQKTLLAEEDCLLYEDMPSAVHLKHTFGSRATVILLFTEGEDELLKVDFASLTRSHRASVVEWRRRLGLKFKDATVKKGCEPTEADERVYIEKKMARAMPDLAFMVGKLRMAEDIRVLANRKDKQEETFAEFKRMVEDVRGNQISAGYGGKFAFVLMPFKDEFNKIYRFVIRPAVERQGLGCLRGDEVFTRLKVEDDIINHIEASELIISDISGGNPNVFLELGISMKLKKPIILITQDAEAPFDVRSCRWIRYANTVDGWEKLNKEISDAIDRVKRREFIVG